MGTIPDALVLPYAVGDGPKLSPIPNLDKVNRICDVAEPILGVDRSKGEHAYIRNQRETRTYFITRSPHDSLQDADGKPRYRWESVGDYQYGYLDDPRSPQTA